MGTEEKKIPIYDLLILRKDDQHITVLESPKYDEVFERYNEVKSQWANCIKDQTPFELTKPIVTTFDPGLIYEITIRLVTETTSSRYENPYENQMRKNGFSSMLNRPPRAMLDGDLLDGGYK